ncbi:MAG: hypothetical protein Q4Q03_07510, partial [Bowdeniella nasicola]|nr:hypothetical protein [Bowdeniella nasicola]
MNATAGLPANTHVHVPPNFSAFATVADTFRAASAEGMQAVGVSNFYDQSVYATVQETAASAGITALFGLEFITQDPDLAAEGILVNDPANAGRVYLCGKGINPFQPKSERAKATAASIRTANDERAAKMLAKLRTYFRDNDVHAELDADAIRADIATRAGVPIAWVSLQERHIARAIYNEIDNPHLLYGQAQAPGDATTAQGIIRARLLKVGKPGFVPEV